MFFSYISRDLKIDFIPHIDLAVGGYILELFALPWQNTQAIWELGRFQNLVN